MASALTATEREIVTLKAVWDAIDGMVNYAIFMHPVREVDAELRFQTAVHQRLFNILLVDLLTEPDKWPFGLIKAPTGTPHAHRNILFNLTTVGQSPQLSPQGGAALLAPVIAFQQWLDAECTVERVWLSTIELESNITIKRIEFIWICGNIAKHSFTRLAYAVSVIQDVLKRNGKVISQEEAFLVLPEFYQWFHEHVFGYHSSAIAEFLNNIRWGIFDYLRPEFLRSYTKDTTHDLKYWYIYPNECERPMAKSMYWDLMNAMRSKPYMPRFEVTRFLKMRY